MPLCRCGRDRALGQNGGYGLLRQSLERHLADSVFQTVEADDADPASCVEDTRQAVQKYLQVLIR